jgi:hypothetical protein
MSISSKLATLATATASVCGLGAATILTSAPAHADQYDYVNYLDNNGVAYRNILGVMALGRENVCHPLRSGYGVDSVIRDVNGYHYAPGEVGLIIRGAVSYMCPDQLPTLKAWVSSRQAISNSGSGGVA